MGNQSSKQHYTTSANKPKKFVHWKSAERPSPPGRPILIIVSDQQPDVITLKWERPRSDGGSPIVGYIVEHRRTGSPHWVRATPALVPRCEASISGLEPGWRYQFRAIAENVVGKSDPSELSDPLTVTLQRNAITVPRFVTELVDTTAVEDNRVEMRVAVVGQPPPEINWFKDGFEIFSSRRTKIVNENDSSALIIHQVAFTDEGEIKCTATNRAGHVVTRARLCVEAPPKIRLPRQYEDGLIAEAEEVVRLKVGIAGQPPPAVIWSHEGQVITPGERFEIVTTDKNSSLKIDNIKRSDRGEYGLRAINKLGEDAASFLVTVTARPDPPGKVTLSMSFGRSATLVWTAPFDDGGCKIGNYIVEYFRLGWNVWLKAATTRKLSVALHDLIEGSEYKFRVKAENPYGVSDPSEESDVLFIPDPTRGITRPELSRIEEQSKPIPPKRKNLSPLRNLLGVGKKNADERESSPARKVSPSRKANLIPEMYDNETMKREMSYGSPLESVDPMDTKRTQKKSESDSIGSHSSFFRRTPSPKPEGSPKLQIPSEQNAKRSPTSTLTESKFNKRMQMFFGVSPNSVRKNSTKKTEETQTEVIKSSPSQKPNEQLVVRSASDVKDYSPKKESPHSYSPINRSPSPLPLPSASPKRSPVLEKAEDNIRSSPLKHSLSPIPIPEQQSRRNSDSMKIDENQNIQGSVRQMMPNPIIHISEPLREPSPRQALQAPSSPEGRDVVHTSSEFMLVFYTNKKTKESEKKESFELDLDEAMAPPPLSLSAPDLAADFQHLQDLPMRRSVSSTELLYERAMARFYEAVELEEAEKSKKRRMSQDQPPAQLTVRKRLGSMSEAERLSFERRSNLRRRVSGDIAQNAIGNIPSRWDSKEVLNLFKNGSSPQAQRKSEQRRSLEKQTSEDSEMKSNESLDYDEDYTDSTASSEDSIEKFKMELLARTRSASGELDTYHPIRMDAGSFSPYRSPEPDQSSVVLSKPHPLPNPDFVPKPILKRPSQESVVKDSNPEISDIKPEEVKPESKSRGLKAFFRREKASSDQYLSKNNNNSSPPKDNGSKKNGKNNHQVQPALPPDTNTRQQEIINNRARLAEEAQRKKLETTRSTEEETKVVVDHYSDIVRELGSVRKSSVPLYMSGDDLKRAAQKAEEEEREKMRKNSIKDDTMDPDDKLLIERSTAKHRLSIVERMQVSHVQPKSKHAMEKMSAIMSSTDTEDKLKSDEETKSNASEDKSLAATRGRAGPAQRKLKRRTPSGTRSRDSSTLKIEPPKGIESDTSTATPTTKRSVSRSRVRTASKSPGALNRRQVKRDITPDIRLPLYIPPPPPIEDRSKTPEELSDEAQENIRSTVSYITDVGLFLVACWVYLFKDARLVIPILALMVYRQIGEALRDRVPGWLTRKKS